MEINVLVIYPEITTLLRFNNMLKTKMDLSIEEDFHKYNGRKEPQKMSNYCHVYNWAPKERNHTLYDSSRETSA